VVKIKKLVYLAISLIGFLFTVYIISQQTKEYSLELEQLKSLQNTYKDIFENNSINERLLKLNKDFKNISDIEKKLNEFDEKLPAFDNANHFIKKLNEFSQATGIQLTVLQNNNSSREFYNANLLRIQIQGNKDSLSKFINLLESVKQLKLLENPSIVQNKKNALQFVMVLYSLPENDDLYYIVDRSKVNATYLTSKIWLPFLSEKSQGNIKMANELIDSFKNNQAQVDEYYAYLILEKEILNKKLIIENLVNRN